MFFLQITAVSSLATFQGDHLQIIPKPLWKKKRKKMLIAKLWVARGWTLSELVSFPSHTAHYLVLSKLRALCVHDNQCSATALQQGAEIG